jgi:hypothetical protein
MILQSIVIGILIALTNTSVAPFSEEIANQILSKGITTHYADEVYLIYVTTSTDHEVFSTFEGYCEPRSNCTVLQVTIIVIRPPMNCMNILLPSSDMRSKNIYLLLMPMNI